MNVQRSRATVAPGGCSVAGTRKSDVLHPLSKNVIDSGRVGQASRGLCATRYAAKTQSLTPRIAKWAAELENPPTADVLTLMIVGPYSSSVANIVRQAVRGIRRLEGYSPLVFERQKMARAFYKHLHRLLQFVAICNGRVKEAKH